MKAKSNKKLRLTIGEHSLKDYNNKTVKLIKYINTNSIMKEFLPIILNKSGTLIIEDKKPKVSLYIGPMKLILKLNKDDIIEVRED